jgi:hypothetical protein
VGRRGVKEFRAPEALALIAADRDRKPLVCPSCNDSTIERTPHRPAGSNLELARITLHCGRCGRTAAYLARGPDPARGPEAPYHGPEADQRPTTPR